MEEEVAKEKERKEKVLQSQIEWVEKLKERSSSSSSSSSSLSSSSPSSSSLSAKGDDEDDGLVVAEKIQKPLNNLESFYFIYFLFFYLFIILFIFIMRFPLCVVLFLNYVNFVW
jgi:hypothetical protein